MGLEMTTEGIRTRTGTERYSERVPDFRGCNTEAGVPNDVWTNGTERRLVLESEGTSGMRGMQG